MKLEEAVVALFVVTVKNDIWNLLATLVKPPPAAFTVRHRFFNILWQTAVTVELYFFTAGRLRLTISEGKGDISQAFVRIPLALGGMSTHALRGDRI